MKSTNTLKRSSLKQSSGSYQKGFKKPVSAPPLPNFIPSPYNFVPFNTTVVKPEWASQVSHDVPFSDSISGSIHISITAETDIYIRNGGVHPENVSERNRDSNYTSFFKLTPNGAYAIPGTSFKGMLRNLIEIITFSKAKLIDDHRYAVRDLQNPFIYSGFLTQKVMIDGKEAWRPKAKAGFLTITGDDMQDWSIIPCDYCRVHHSELRDAYDWHFNRHEKLEGKQKEEKQSAPAKYKLWEAKHTSLAIKFTPGPEELHKNIFLYKEAKDVGKGATTGTVVFTGQPSDRKSKEFVFYNEQPQKAIRVTETLKSAFLYAHSSNDGFNREWDFWYQRARKNPHTKIPVFYLEESPGVPASMGLCLMYRLSYKYTIHHCLKNSSQDHLNHDKLDFAETLFGDIDSDPAVRGRIAVEPLVITAPPPHTRHVVTILNSPKPSYYCNYVQQKCDPLGHVPLKVPQGQKREKGFYSTYMDKDALLAGWKRYPVRKKVAPLDPTDNQENVTTVFDALPAGVTFEGTMHVHNLTKIELGALWWALSWGGNLNLRFNIGMAKPFGFGMIRINATPHLYNLHHQPCDVTECTALFEQYMKEHVPDWESSSQLVELRAMADPSFTPVMELRYPSIGSGTKTNEFIRFKACDKDNGILPKALVKYSTKPHQSYSNTLTSKSPSHPPQSAPYANKQLVECVVLSEKTKTNKWRFKIVGGSNSDVGVLKPDTKKPAPPDLAPGKVYKMIVVAVSPNNFQFDWAD